VHAIDKVGYRLIDGYIHSISQRFNSSAWGYGNEVEVGNALKECQTPRSEIFVTVLLALEYSDHRLNYGEHITLKSLKALKIPFKNSVSKISIVSRLLTWF